MTDEEIKKKDWQLLTAHGIMELIANVNLIRDNQVFIISKITGIPSKDVCEKMNVYYKNELAKVDKSVREGIPNYSPIEREY